MTAQTDPTPNSRRSPMEHDRDLPDDAREGLAELARLGQQMDAQTDAPERIWITLTQAVSGWIRIKSLERVPRLEYIRADILADWQASQGYRYIGKDGKPVLARDLEDERDAAQAEIAKLRGQNAKCREYIDKLEVELRKADPDNLLIMVGSEMRALLAYVATEAQP